MKTMLESRIGRTGGPSENSKTVVVGCSMLPNSFDPDQFSGPDLPSPSPDNSDVNTQIFDRLFTYAEVRRYGSRIQDTDWPVGELVEHWDAEPGYFRHRMTLRETVSQWGNRLTAEDVVWSWKKAFAGREVGRWAAFMGSVSRGDDGVRAIDDRTVEFVLTQPNRLFPHVLTIDVPPILDSTEAQRHATADDPWAQQWLRLNPCGFGPYALSSRTTSELVLEARADHWAGQAGIERVVYRLLEPDSDRIDALCAGEIDVLFNPTPEEIVRLRLIEDLTVFSAPGSAHVSLQMDARAAPFDDPLVRRALAFAVPYETILSEVFLGTARPWRGVVPDSHPGALDCLTVKTDIAESASLLHRAGRSNGVAATLHCDAGLPPLVKVAEHISRWASLVGFELQVHPLATKEFKARQNAFLMPLAVDHDGHRCNEIGYGVPHDFGDRRHGITNWVRYNNDEVNRLIGLAESEIDSRRRIRIFQECQRIIERDTPWAFVAQPNFYVAARRGLTGFAWHSRGSGRPRYVDLAWV